MRSILSGERGLAPAMLIVVIAWALAAVLMLTGTLVSASRIDDDVKLIKPEVSDIGTDSRAIALAARTNRVAGQIRTAARPLTGELAATLSTATDIDTVAKSILRKAGAINQTVGTINGTVDAISANAQAINASVRAINRNARSINGSVQSINGHVAGIGASVRGIDGSGTSILASVRSIDPAIAAINRRAVTIQEVGRTLGTDLAAVLTRVGRIAAHANSIDCSRLLNLTGATASCGR